MKNKNGFKLTFLSFFFGGGGDEGQDLLENIPLYILT